MGYTDQQPAEYAAVVLAAAIKEGHEGPVFIQGDHFQINAKNTRRIPTASGRRSRPSSPTRSGRLLQHRHRHVDARRPLTVHRHGGAAPQLRGTAAHFTRFIRAREPKGVTISVGGEIGEVGKDVSSPEEFRAFMNGYNAALPPGMVGVSKISINTGTSHGGVVLPDGTVAKVSIAFDSMQPSRRSRGPSTAPRRRRPARRIDAAGRDVPRVPEPRGVRGPPRHRVPEHGLRASALPKALKDEMYAWLKANAADERKANDTDEQFLYRSRKKAIGPFKKSLWELPEAARQRDRRHPAGQVRVSLGKLRVQGTRNAVARFVKPVEVELAAAGGTFVRDDEAGD